MKSYTSWEQSKQLAEFLPLESADMYYLVSRAGFVSQEERNTPKVGIPKKDAIKDYWCPCWSLATLLDVLPYPQLSKDKLGSGNEGWMVSVYPNDCRYDSCWHDNPVDACYEMIEKLHEQNIL